MSYEILKVGIPILLALLSAVASLVSFMIKKLSERVQRLEEKRQELATRQDCRQIVNDKIDPLERQMQHIEQKLDKIIEIMLSAR